MLKWWQARRSMISRTSAREARDSSRITGSELRAVSQVNPSRSSPASGCSTLSRENGAKASRFSRASSAFQAQFASMRILQSSPRMRRDSRRRPRSSSRLMPTLSLTRSKPIFRIIPRVASVASTPSAETTAL